MTAVIQVDQERAEQFLGASEAAGVLGLDKYNPPIKIWRRHRGLEVEDSLPKHVSEAAEWGQLHEPIVRGKYALMTRSVVEVPTKSTVRDSWLRCTPDGIVFDYGRSRDPGVHDDEILPGSPEDRQGLLQCKTADAHLDWEWQDGPPARYEVQVRVEMAVMELPWCDVLCLVGGNRLRGPFRVERDIAIEKRILGDLHAFWQFVVGGIEPSVDHTDAWRLHVSQKMRDTKAVVQADRETLELLEDMRSARGQLARAKAIVDTQNNELLLRMSAVGTQVVESALGRFSAYRAGAGMDWMGYAEHLEQLVPAISGADRTIYRADFKRASTKWAIHVPRGFTAGDDE